LESFPKNFLIESQHESRHVAARAREAFGQPQQQNIGAAMATKNDLAQVFSDIKAIRDDLDDLRDAVGNLTGFRKEIDHAFDRIAAIERHFGIENKATV
jgi:hypothetical protein